MENKLTEEEQRYIIGRVREMMHSLESERASIQNKIDYYKKKIRGAITQIPDDKYRSFYIEKLKQEIALLDGSFDGEYLKVQHVETEIENVPNTTPVILKKELTQLVSNDEIEMVIKKLLKLTENSEELHQEVVQVSSRFERNNKKIRTDVADSNKTDIEHNKIIEALLDIINKI